MCTSKGIRGEKTLQASRVTAAISVYTAGGCDSVWMKQAGEELCRVHCEWIMPTINWASAHQRGGLAGNMRKSTFLTTAYEHFPAIPSCIMVCIKEKSKPSALALIAKLIKKGVYGDGLREIPLMFPEIPNNFSVFWRTLDFQVENMSACEMLVLSSTNRLNVPLKSVIEFAPILEIKFFPLSQSLAYCICGWNSGRLLQQSRLLHSEITL